MLLSLDKLIEAYNNEKSTRKLLKYNIIVEEFNRYLINTDVSLPGNDLQKAIQEIEIERIKYFVKEYLLTRLDKLRTSFFHNLELMSIPEQNFYNDYLELSQKNNIINEELQTNEIEIVGFKALQDLGNIKIDNEVITLYKDDFCIAAFDDIDSYLLENKILLM